MILRKHLPIVLLLTTALLIGALTVSDYGESWDEGDAHRYSEYVLHSYRFLLHPQDLPEFDPIISLYGPSYFVVANLLGRLLPILHPGWSLITAWHFVYFVTFLAGALAFYMLCLRWMSQAAAFGATLLLLSQPLLWGHAFINPKDTPFMACFTITVLLGLHMTDNRQAGILAKSWLVLSAVFLGITSSFRVAGPLAGVIVLGYALRKRGAQSIRSIAVYIGVAAVTVYLTWPYLWKAPIDNLLVSARTMASFPGPGNVLFAGQLYAATQLPRVYFPALLGVQMTETALLLQLAGLAVLAFGPRTRPRLATLVLLGVWFVVPAAFVLITRPPLYDNARQLQFLLPPVFMLAGVALDELFSRVSRAPARAAILLAAVLPGLVGGLELHPYEYIYYNSVVGGTGGAYRHYEMDYWATSFKEIGERISAEANRGANVLVYGAPPQLLRDFVRPDIEVFATGNGPPVPYSYVVSLNRFDPDFELDGCRDSEAIYSVERQGAVFSVLKRVPPDAECH